jgi:predicted AlkP superfamily pyrophosphatase or phosphodiesterase
MRTFLCSVLILFLTSIGCTPQPHASSTPAPGKTVVVWISIDGFRRDYVDKAPNPFFHKLMKEGAYSRQLTTITPSITFPSHVSEATGVTVDQHGIPNNDFYDSITKKPYHFPADPALLQSEPIWLTAKRQGIRTLVYDWPLSQGQTAELRTDYFLPKFEGAPTDEQRLARLVETWRTDTNPQPLQLLMGYIKATDSIGHKYGPDSPELKAAVEETDRNLGRFVDAVTTVFQQKSSPGDQLYILLTTDHGMMTVKTLVNLEKLFATPLPRSVHHETGGPLGMIYLYDLPAAEQATSKQSMLADLKKYDFLDAYTRDTLPKEWRFDHPTRVGDVIIMLKPGYTFSTRLPLASFPVADGPGPYGMHGYPPDQCSDMLGFCALWRYPKPLGGKDLGKVDALQVHPTVAKILNINPAEGAKAKPLLP